MSPSVQMPNEVELLIPFNRQKPPLQSLSSTHAVPISPSMQVSPLHTPVGQVLQPKPGATQNCCGPHPAPEGHWSELAHGPRIFFGRHNLLPR